MNRFAIEHSIFSKIAKVKRCGSCFRCREVDSHIGQFWELSYKPRRGKKVRCSSACSPECTGVDMKACEWWEPRWYWNAGQRWSRYKYMIGRWYCENIRIPIGRRRKPVELEWVDSLGIGGELIPRGEPRCPHCGEMPYSTEQCRFCGQRFLGANE